MAAIDRSSSDDALWSGAVTDNQRDLFLYQWSRRRAPGRTRILLRGALIGGLGGLAFALVLASGGAHASGASNDTAGQIVSFLQLLGMSVLTFGGMAVANAHRVWRTQEMFYQSLLASGAQVPSQKPELTLRERGPMIAVGITVVVLAGLIAALIWAANTGRL